MSDEIKNEVSLLDDAPDFGNETMTFDDVSKPFLRILQAMSPVCVKGNQSYNPEAEPGLFMNSLTGYIYGDTVQLIRLKFEKAWIEQQNDANKTFVKRHSIEPEGIDKANFSKWMLPNGNLVKEIMVYYVIVVGHEEDGMLLFSLSSSQMKHAKTWNNYIMLAKTPSGKKAQGWRYVWEVSLVVDQNKSGQTYFNIGTGNVTKIKKVREVTSDELGRLIAPNIQVLQNMKELNYKQIAQVQIEDQTDEEKPY